MNERTPDPAAVQAAAAAIQAGYDAVKLLRVLPTRELRMFALAHVLAEMEARDRGIIATVAVFMHETAVNRD